MVGCYCNVGRLQWCWWLSNYWDYWAWWWFWCCFRHNIIISHHTAGTYKIWDGLMTKSFLVFRRQTVLEKFCTHKVPPVKWTHWLSNSPWISTFHEWCSSSRCLINRPVVGPRLEAVECCQLPVCEWWPGASHWAHGHHSSWDCESSRSGSSWSN